MEAFPLFVTLTRTKYGHWNHVLFWSDTQQDNAVAPSNIDASGNVSSIHIDHMTYLGCSSGK